MQQSIIRSDFTISIEMRTTVVKSERCCCSQYGNINIIRVRANDYILCFGLSGCYRVTLVATAYSAFAVWLTVSYIHVWVCVFLFVFEHLHAPLPLSHSLLCYPTMCCICVLLEASLSYQELLTCSFTSMLSSRNYSSRPNLNTRAHIHTRNIQKRTAQLPDRLFHSKRSTKPHTYKCSHSSAHSHIVGLRSSITIIFGSVKFVCEITVRQNLQVLCVNFQSKTITDHSAISNLFLSVVRVIIPSEIFVKIREKKTTSDL